MIYYYVKLSTEETDIVFYTSMKSLFEGKDTLDVSYGVIKINKDYADDDGVAEEKLKEMLK